MSDMPTQTFIDFLKTQTIEEIAGAMIELQKTVDRLKAEQPAPVAKPHEQEPVATLKDEVIGCFNAAFVEGLQEALAETQDERLKDLVERRLMYALYAARDTSPPAQRKPLTEWQPIETAPKNGFRILLYSPSTKDFSMPFENIVIGWYVIGRIPADGYWGAGVRRDGKYIGHHIHNPTHWMPLPNTPDAHNIKGDA